MEDGVRLLELARNASQLFAQQAPGEKKRLLNLVLSNCEWNRGEVRASFRQPFGLLAETAAAAGAREALEPSYPQGIQFGWGSWKLFELSALHLQPNCERSSKRSGYRHPLWDKFNRRREEFVTVRFTKGARLSVYRGFESEDRYIVRPTTEDALFYFRRRSA